MDTSEILVRYLLCGFIVNYFTVLITNRIEKWIKVKPQYKVPFIIGIVAWPYNFALLLFVGLICLAFIIFILVFSFFIFLVAGVKFVFYSFIDFVKSRF